MERDRLEPSYRRAIYRVDLDGRALELRIGERSAPLDRSLEAAGASSWAIVTACNPGSVPLAPEENRRRNDRLERRLARAGWSTRPAEGLDPDGLWPTEPGFLVLEAPLSALIAIAAELGQAAIVAGRREAAPELIWIGERPQAPPVASR